MMQHSEKYRQNLKRKVMPAALLLGFGAALAGTAQANDAGQAVEWQTLGSDLAHTRSTTADHIDRENFDNLEVAWSWDGASFGASSGRSTPSYVDGLLYTVAGDRRHVIAIDPETGETVWSHREPHTFRHEYSMRKNYGKGVAYGEVDGRGVIYIISPAFFLTALDAKTGAPLEGFGEPVPVEGFPSTGVVDLQKRIADYMGYEFDAYHGIPLEEGYITSSSPPIVVNDVVIVGNSGEQGYNQTRIENIPGDVLAFDAATGEFKWRFNTIPENDEFGIDTWEVDNPRELTGQISPWAPLSADADAGLVYIPTKGTTIDYYGGHHPGDNLFITSLIAVDVETGERSWHFQMVKHDLWNYDTPTAPILLDVEHNGETVPIVAQATKQAFTYVFNRLTGEPIWDIVDRPVPPSMIPGEQAAATQPFPTKPAPYEMQGLTYDDLIDFTPELYHQAVETIRDYEIGPLFNPPLHRDNDLGKVASLWCPGDSGGVNITAPPVADPETGVMYIMSRKACTSRVIAPAEERDAMIQNPTGTTLADYAPLRSVAPRGPQGLPIYRPPYSRITAIDLNTGDTMWWIPVGETPEYIENHPALEGIDVGNTGSGSVAPMMVTPDLLMYANTATDGTPILFAVDKQSGDTVGRVEVPDISRYGMMSYVHNGRQYVMLQTGGTLTAMALPY